MLNAVKSFLSDLRNCRKNREALEYFEGVYHREAEAHRRTKEKLEVAEYCWGFWEDRCNS